MNRIRRGISLLEIVIAMQCIALILVMISRVMPLARRQFRDAEHRLGGAMLAQNVLEEYLTVPTEQWPTESVAVKGDPRQVGLELLPWPADPRLKLARATVWVGGEERYRLETLVTP